MSQLLTVLLFTSDDHAQADALLGLLSDYNGKQPNGHLLLVTAPDVHAELTEKMKISAEVAFESVTVLPVAWPTSNGQLGKYRMVNHCFRAAATVVAERFAWPYLFLEPDCVPINPNWLELIRDEYNAQPKRYIGSWLKDQTGIFMDRVGVYPTNAILQLGAFFEQEAPFNLQAREATVNRSTKSAMFQAFPKWDANTSRDALKATAVIYHGDKSGILLQAVRDEWKKRPEVFVGDGLKVTVHLTPEQQEARAGLPAGTTGSLADIINPVGAGEIADVLAPKRPTSIPTPEPKRRGRPPNAKNVAVAAT